MGDGVAGEGVEVDVVGERRRAMWDYVWSSLDGINNLNQGGKQ